MTNFFATSKSLGFTVITSNRPFHLFAENSESRLRFLNGLLSIKDPQNNNNNFEKNIIKETKFNKTTPIHIQPFSILNQLAISEDISPKKKYSIIGKFPQKIKIIPYATKPTYDPVAKYESIERKRKPSNSLSQSANNPFTVVYNEKEYPKQNNMNMTTTNIKSNKEEIKVVRLNNKANKEKITLSNYMQKRHTVIRNDNLKLNNTIKYDNEAYKTVQGRTQSTTICSTYRKRRRLSRKMLEVRNNETCVAQDFEYEW